jgi:hypothetical protein
MSISFNFHDDTLTVLVKNSAHTLKNSHPNFKRIMDAIRQNDEKLLEDLLKPSTDKFVEYIEKSTNNRVKYVNGRVFLDDKELNNIIVDRIREFARFDLPFNHLLLFIENLSKNPSYRAQQELFKFLENKNLPITEDGCFLAYKAVNQNWRDIYSDTIDNTIGNTISIERNLVDDNCNHACSAGLHCGAIPYVTSYGGDNSIIIIVKVNPADVVSVPLDSNCQKIRVCKYVCFAKYEGPLSSPLYRDDMSDPTKYDDTDWDDFDDLDDEDYDDEDDYEDKYTSSQVKVEKSCCQTDQDIDDCCVQQMKAPKRDKYGRFCK